MPASVEYGGSEEADGLGGLDARFLGGRTFVGALVGITLGLVFGYPALGSGTGLGFGLTVGIGLGRLYGSE